MFFPKPRDVKLSKRPPFDADSWHIMLNLYSASTCTESLGFSGSQCVLCCVCVCVFFNSGWFFRRQVLGVSVFFFFGWRPGCGNVWENSREIPKMVCTKMTWTAVICCGFYGFLFGRQMMEPYVPYFGPAIHDRRLNCSLCKRFLWHCMTRD